MALGCNLLLTKKDLDNVEHSLNAKRLPKKSEFAANALDSLLKQSPKEFTRILRHKGDPRYQLLLDLALESMGKNKVTPNDEAQIPAALEKVLEFTPNITGLFKPPSKAYGPGASRVLHPYEVLTAAAVVQKVNKGGITSLNGKPLLINKLDNIFMGHKSAARYALGKKGGTFESDILISPDDKSIAPTGLDAKYSKNGSYNSYDADTERQLKGIVNAFNDGQLKDFFFVTNGRFGPKMNEKVTECNELLVKNWLRKNERNHGINDELRNDHQTLVLRFDIPQICLCEQVSFMG